MLPLMQHILRINAMKFPFAKGNLGNHDFSSGRTRQGLLNLTWAKPTWAEILLGTIAFWPNPLGLFMLVF